jgi:hypothetical protein
MKHLHEHFKTLADPLRLSIALRMVGEVCVHACSRELEEVLPEFACEDWIAVRDYSCQ